MSRFSLHRRNPFAPLCRRLVAVAVAAGCLLLPAFVSAQAKKKAGPDHEKKTGKVAEVEKKGKASILTVEESDGEKFEVLVSGKMKFVVNGTGDAGFFKYPKASVTSDSVFTANRQYFGKKFTIHIGHVPPAMFEPDENNAEVFHIAGPIVDCDDASFTIDVGGQPWKINFEQGADLTVAIVSSEPEHAVVGSPVEVEGATRAGKFHAASVVVNLDRPLVADDLLAAEGEKKPGKSRSTAASKTKKGAKTDKKDKGDKEETADKGDDPPASTDPIKPSTDPFGVLNDKKGPKKKAPAPKPKAKKPADGDVDN
jgi:hypothetical protein